MGSALSISSTRVSGGENVVRGRSKRKASQITRSISILPNPIIYDILSRLPLRSIFTCKRVCKIWRDLTLEPYFAKLHLSRSPLSLITYRNAKLLERISYHGVSSWSESIAGVPSFLTLPGAV